MDPTETLNRLRELVEEQRQNEYIWEMAQYFEKLDKYLSDGGFLPEPWNYGYPRGSHPTHKTD